MDRQESELNYSDRIQFKDMETGELITTDPWHIRNAYQNQIEKFGQHFFKAGAKVIPGNTGYNRIYYCIQLVNTFQGVPVAAYAEQLVGTKITGLTSGVTAFVDSVLLPEDSERGNLTLYINYLDSSSTNNSTQTFSMLRNWHVMKSSRLVF